LVKTVSYDEPARRALRKLPTVLREQIEAKIARYAATGAGDVKALAGGNRRRLRHGDYRVIFTEDGDRISVLLIGNRREVYR